MFVFCAHRRLRFCTLVHVFAFSRSCSPSISSSFFVFRLRFRFRPHFRFCFVFWKKGPPVHGRRVDLRLPRSDRGRFRSVPYMGDRPAGWDNQLCPRLPAFLREHRAGCRAVRLRMMMLLCLMCFYAVQCIFCAFCAFCTRSHLIFLCIFVHFGISSTYKNKRNSTINSSRSYIINFIHPVNKPAHKPSQTQPKFQNKTIKLIHTSPRQYIYFEVLCFAHFWVSLGILGTS